MAKKQLDLSHTLVPLENELKTILQEICAQHDKDSVAFDAAIEDFISKYGGSGYRSLEDLLAASALEASYQSQEEAPSLDELLKDLLA